MLTLPNHTVHALNPLNILLRYVSMGCHQPREGPLISAVIPHVDSAASTTIDPTLYHITYFIQCSTIYRKPHAWMLSTTLRCGLQVVE
jgi:hypothetical protein